MTELKPDRRLRRIHYDWLEAGEHTQRTVARLSEQLRRFLDDQAWLENRRIMELLRGIEQKAVSLRDTPPKKAPMEIDSLAPNVELVMERPLFSPPLRPDIQTRVLQEGDQDLDAEALFNQIYVDREMLREGIRRALRDRNQISLAELVEAQPLRQGLAELVTYVAIAADDDHALIDESRGERIDWTSADGRSRRARLPLIVFSR